MQICTIYTYHLCLFVGLLTVTDPDLELPRGTGGGGGKGGEGGKGVCFACPGGFSSFCNV